MKEYKEREPGVVMSFFFQRKEFFRKNVADSISESLTFDVCWCWRCGPFFFGMWFEPDCDNCVLRVLRVGYLYGQKNERKS